jgi:hypothetical protein
MRMCIDYRAHNRRIIKSRCPLLRIDDVLDQPEIIFIDAVLEDSKTFEEF